MKSPAALPGGIGVEVLPADGTPLAVGHYSTVSGKWTSGARPRPVVRLVNSTLGCTLVASPAAGAAWLDVQAISYDSAGVVTELAASFLMPCTASAASVAGEIRYRSSLPYASASTSFSPLGDVTTGSTNPLLVTVTNTGTLPLVLGAPAPVDHASDVPSLVEAPDGETCSQAPLAAGASCALHLDYVDDGISGGGWLAETRLPAADLPRGYLPVIVAVSGVIEVPAAPSGVGGGVGYDGVQLHWSWGGSGDFADGYRIRRVDGGTPVVVGTVPFGTYQWSDTSLAKGETATYVVSAYNAAGEASGPSITLTRPDLADPPAASDRRVLVVEDDKGSAVGDAAAGSTVSTTTNELEPEYLRIASGNASLLIKRLPYAPGTYALGTGPGQIPVGVDSPTYGCSTYGGSVDGTVDIREAWIRADLTIHRLDADFHLLCGNARIEAQVRIGTDTDVSALTTSGTLTNYQATVGEVPDSRTLQVANAGSTPLTLGARTITGYDAAAFSIVSDSCPSVLAVGATCSVDVAFAPVHSRSNTAQLSFATGTPVGTRTLDLSGSAIGPPPIQHPQAQAVLGRVYVYWNQGEDGGSPVTGYHVLRAVGAGPFQAVADVPVDTYSWVDDTVTPGNTYSYQLLTDNAYGAMPPSDNAAVAVVVPHEELVASVLRASAQPADLESLEIHGNGVPVGMGTGQDTDEPALSPDGRWVAYVAYDVAGDAGLWLRSIDGSVPPRVLVDDPSADELDPAWSPDSTTVAYTRDADTGTSVWSIGLGGAPAAQGVAIRVEGGEPFVAARRQRCGRH